MGYIPKIGDIVRVRSWEDMESEFGVDDRGTIQTTIPFISLMKEYCGLVFEVTDVSRRKSRFGCYYAIGGIKASNPQLEISWGLSSDMIELVKVKDEMEIDAANSNELDSYLQTVTII